MVFLEICSCWMSGHVVWSRQFLIQPWMAIFDGVFVCFGLVIFVLCLFQIHCGEAGFGVLWQRLEAGHILAEAILLWHARCLDLPALGGTMGFSRPRGG